MCKFRSLKIIHSGFCVLSNIGWRSIPEYNVNLYYIAIASQHPTLARVKQRHQLGVIKSCQKRSFSAFRCNALLFLQESQWAFRHEAALPTFLIADAFIGNLCGIIFRYAVKQHFLKLQHFLIRINR